MSLMPDFELGLWNASIFMLPHVLTFPLRFQDLLITIMITVEAVAFMGLEEQRCLRRYGDVYRECMNRTPRWIGILKSEG